MPNKPEWIIVHHTAVSRSVNENQFDAVDRYHKSKGWGGIGYHYLIEADGNVRKGREELATGAHTYQQGMNAKSIGICLTGNFDQEEPTEKQVASLRSLIKSVMDRYKIATSKVVPHRHFAPKSCCGKNLSDAELKDIANSAPMYDQVLRDRLKGKLLLQVQDKGKLWFVSDKGEREYLGTGYIDYLRFMDRVRKGLVPTIGISNEDIKKVPEAV